ncbi:SPOR domain-containing protein [Stappia sp. F7233]|uniref:SPOR domain-containing protein n=1 Tax=Stappia albiluteola TaxID=2758565 RepID=A0A839ACL4_9HYPH|nr:SPOR domain-containing protein [Stappia albiluteola]MBA5776724.1 SPOR domain-containing protein [Stappia albiluteola]
MPENDRSDERMRQGDPYEDFDEDPLVELARIVSEGSNARLPTVAPQQYDEQQYQADDQPAEYDEVESSAEGEAEDWGLEEQGLPYNPEYSEEEADYQYRAAEEAEPSPGYEQADVFEPDEAVYAAPVAPYGQQHYVTEGFVAGQPTESYEEEPQPQYQSREEPYEDDAVYEGAPEAMAEEEYETVPAQSPDTDFAEQLMAGFEDELRSAFDQKFGAPAAQDAGTDAEDYPQPYGEETAGRAEATSSDEEIYDDLFSEEAEVEAREQARRSSEASAGRGLTTAGVAPVVAAAAFTPARQVRSQATPIAAPAAAPAQQQSQPQSFSAVEDDYDDDLYEDLPPAQGYDIEAVARAMKESDPALSGHGVLPPHSPAEELATPEGRSRRGLAVAVAILGLAVIGGAVFALVDFGESGVDIGPPQVIAAQEGPLKVYPEQDSEEKPSQSKLIYDRVGGNAGGTEERLIVQEETPVASLPPAPATEEQLSPSTGLVQPSGPRRVRTVIVRPDGTIISEDEAEAAATGVTPPAVEPTPAAEPRDVTAAVEPASPVSVPETAAEEADPVEAVTPEAAAPVEGAASPVPAGQPGILPRPKPEGAAVRVASAPATSAPAANTSQPLDLTTNEPAQAAPSAPAVQTASVPRGSYVVQISSQRSEEQARTSFADLQKRYPDVLASIQPVIEKAELGDRGIFYRVRIPYGSRDEAISLCENLKAAGGDCFVRQN